MLSLYGVEKEISFQKWKQRAVSIPYMERKRKKQIFFKINLANSTFRSLYDVKRRLYFLQQIRLSCPYVVRKEENEAVFAKMHRSICTNSVREYNLNRQIKIRHSY